MKLDIVVPGLLEKHPLVKGVSLTGSQVRGSALKWSDWDFLVETDDFEALAEGLPGLIAGLKPLSYLWDPLGRHKIFMMVLKGPVKVDILFDQPHRPELPWVVNRDNLGNINNHFWDWILWIASKAVRGRADVVKNELEKMHVHLLATLGCAECPASVEEAVNMYATSFQVQKKRLDMELNQSLEKEVIKGLKEMGFRV